MLELPTIIRVLSHDHVIVNQVVRQFVSGDILTVQECMARIIHILAEQNKGYEDRAIMHVRTHGTLP